MSDGTLIERVARALCTGTDPDSVSPYSGDVLWQCREPEARAAIRAVAEHLLEVQFYPERLVAALLLKELDPTAPEDK